jgi:hypothetical protein
MKAKDWIKDNKIKLAKSQGEEVLPLDFACELMQQYAFEAWKNAENNGRKRLSSEGNLDVNGSMVDFERWLSGEQF